MPHSLPAIVPQLLRYFGYFFNQFTTKTHFCYLMLLISSLLLKGILADFQRMVERVRGIKGIPSSPLRHPLTCRRSILATNTLYTLCQIRNYFQHHLSVQTEKPFFPKPLLKPKSFQALRAQTEQNTSLRFDIISSKLWSPPTSGNALPGSMPSLMLPSWFLLPLSQTPPRCPGG